VIAGSASQEPAMIDVRHLLPRTQTICGFILARITEVDPGEPSRALVHLCDLIRSGRLHPRYEIVALEDAVEVHRRMDGRSVTGKVILQP
jgi:NADPH:quinone reductase-like Zn-dependent oxidoreductase